MDSLRAYVDRYKRMRTLHGICRLIASHIGVCGRCGFPIESPRVDRRSAAPCFHRLFARLRVWLFRHRVDDHGRPNHPPRQLFSWAGVRELFSPPIIAYVPYSDLAGPTIFRPLGSGPTYRPFGTQHRTSRWPLPPVQRMRRIAGIKREPRAC
jgi:hypothetical protein